MQLRVRGSQADARGSCLSQVLVFGAQVVARGAVPCASKVLDCDTEAVARGAVAVRRTYLIVVLRPVLRPLPAATRRCCIRRRTLGR
jgi:hypothetical protein